ncbi:MAG: DNA starvation/stationary phase protection protein Dps [Cyanobacteria bacterium P01_F01_bin.116]
MDRLNSGFVPFQEPRFYKTQANIPDDIRIQLVELLNQSLANTIDLKSQIFQAIWHVRGINFYQHYLLFSDVSDQLDEQITLLGERISALASTPLLTVKLAAQYSQLSEFPFHASTTEEILQALAQQVSLHSKCVRLGILQATDLGDATTAQTYTKISSTVDKHLWLLESHCNIDG